MESTTVYTDDNFFILPISNIYAETQPFDIMQSLRC